MHLTRNEASRAALRRRRAIVFLHVAALCAAMVAPSLASAKADPLAPLLGHWEGTATHQGKTFRVNLDVAPGRGGTVYLDYPDYQLYGAVFTASLEKDAVRIERNPPGGPSSLVQGKLAGNRIEGTFTGAGAKDAKLSLRKTDRPPIVFREEEVTFSNGDVRLVGTIIFPQGPGPHPVVVFTHGGSPDHRGLAVYRSEGVLFARSGVAALIYDKRGTGQSTGDWTVSGIEEFAGDAIAGIRALKNRKDIDSKRIGIAGHSQGGWIAPYAATISPDIAFVIVTSASGINAMEQSVFHRSNVLREAGFSEEVVKRAADLRNRLYERARKGAFDERLPADLEAASKEPWFEASALPYPVSAELADGMRRLLLFEPVPVWERVHVPVLAIWGSRDIHLPAERSLEIIRGALARGGNARVKAHVYPGLDHGFSAPPSSAGWDFPRRPDDYDDIVAGWLRENVLGRGARA
jgi:pimeloyl-ACP methyl ester carboxylesterase